MSTSIPGTLTDSAVQHMAPVALDFVQTLPPKNTAGSRSEERKTEMTRFFLGILAYIVPTFALGFVWHLMLFERILRGACDLSERHHHSVWISLDADPGGPLRLDLRKGVCAAERHACCRARWPTPPSALSLVELHDARCRRQERDGIGSRLSPDRDRLYGRAVDHGRAADRVRLCCRCGAQKQAAA